MPPAKRPIASVDVDRTRGSIELEQTPEGDLCLIVSASLRQDRGEVRLALVGSRQVARQLHDALGLWLDQRGDD